jgi:hypothetical protein
MALLFFASVTATLALMHAYLWRRLVLDTGLPRRLRRALTAALIALPALMMASAAAVVAAPC